MSVRHIVVLFLNERTYRHTLSVNPSFFERYSLYKIPRGTSSEGHW